MVPIYLKTPEFEDADHPAYFLATANGMVATRQHPSAGTLSVAWRYVQFGNTEPAPGRPTPLLGEHNDEVLREVGYDDDAIRRLHADGVVKTETV